MSQLRLLSLSHKNSYIHTREQYALTLEEVSRLLHDSQHIVEIEEMLVLSTCNRTEILYVSQENASLSILYQLSAIKNMPPKHAEKVFKNQTDEKGVLNYVFEVAAGLQSQILGDAQIITQIKSAYNLANQKGMIGSYLHRLIHVIFSTNKKITNQTDFRSGISSVPYAVACVVNDYQSLLPSKRIAVIGFGEMGQLICKHLLKAGNHQITVVNRTKERISQFNQKSGPHLKYHSLDKLPQILETHDIILSSISTPQPIIDQSHFGKFNSSSPCKLLVDISIPRSIHSNVDQHPLLIRFDMEHISEITQKTLARKKAAIPSVKAIINIALADFLKWKEVNNNLEVVRSMKSALETIKLEELDRFKRHYKEGEKEHFELVMDAMIQKIIKKTVVSMKSLPNGQKRDQFSAVISQTFLRQH